jgi:preprotein translocase subunit SecB
MDTKEPAQQSFQILRFYTKEITCKVPHAPNFFISENFIKGDFQPIISLEMHVKHQALTNNQYEVVLQAQVSAKTKENTTAFTIDLQQAGIFEVKGLSNIQLEQLLKTYFSSLLYPYLCRTIWDTSIQAGFPPVLLPPASFGQPQQHESVQNNTNEKSLGSDRHDSIAQTEAAM